MTKQSYSVLFVGTQNSGRSIMAEASCGSVGWGGSRPSARAAIPPDRSTLWR